MKSKKLIIIIAAIVIVVCAVIVLFPVHAVNVVFDRCLNAGELPTVFSGTSFRSRQHYFVGQNGAGLAVTGNVQLFGSHAPLEGAELEAALKSEPRNSGTIVVDGNASLLDIRKLRERAFIDKVIIYFPILYGGDREVLPEATTLFFDKHPEARYWE